MNFSNKKSNSNDDYNDDCNDYNDDCNDYNNCNDYDDNCNNCDMDTLLLVKNRRIRRSMDDAIFTAFLLCYFLFRDTSGSPFISHLVKGRYRSQINVSCPIYISIYSFLCVSGTIFTHTFIYFTSS